MTRWPTFSASKSRPLCYTNHGPAYAFLHGDSVPPQIWIYLHMRSLYIHNSIHYTLHKGISNFLSACFLKNKKIWISRSTEFKLSPSQRERGSRMHYILMSPVLGTTETWYIKVGFISDKGFNCMYTYYKIYFCVGV